MLRTMSLFNKPKRNIRRRPFNDDDEDNENRMEVEDTQPIKSKTKKKDKPKQTLLSFGEELEEGNFWKIIYIRINIFIKYIKYIFQIFSCIVI